MANKLRKWIKETDAFELGAIIFIIVGIVLVVGAIILGIYTNITITGGGDWYNITTYSEFIAGLIGGVWSLAGVLLFYSSLSSQKADLEAQKDLLVKQIDEVVAQTKEFRIQNEMSRDQKNEETFFQLLRFHNEIISTIELEHTDVDFATGENITKSIVGRKAFVEYYDIFKRFFGETSESIVPDGDESTAKLFDTCYNTFYLEYQADLGHYFRNLYNILKFTKSVKVEIRPFFLSLLIAQLSNYELTLLFFHCLRQTNTEFKKLVEEFEVLAQVPKDEVTSMAFTLYDIKAFGDDGFGSGDNLEPDHGDIDFESDSLLGKISAGFEDSESSLNKKGSSVDFMEDLLSRLKNVDKKEDTTSDENVEIEEGNFLDDFFDKQEKDVEDNRSKLLVEKEKVIEKEKEEFNINSLIGKIAKDDIDLDDTNHPNMELPNFDNYSDEESVKEVNSELGLDMFFENSEDYSNSDDLESIKSKFSSEVKLNEGKTEGELNLSDLDIFMDDEDDNVVEDNPVQDNSNSSAKNEESFGLDILDSFKEDEKNEDDLDTESEINEQELPQSNQDLSTKQPKEDFQENNKTTDKPSKPKSKKIVKVKNRNNDNKPSGGSGFLSKL
jgi:hypothetical protein